MDSRDSHPRLHILNTLGGALAHYSTEAQHVSGEAGLAVRITTVFEPAVVGGGSFQWLRRYIRELRKARATRREEHLFVTWPVIGYLDVLLVWLFVGRGTVVIHDPEPLVHARGYGRIARMFASFIVPRVGIIVHSKQAHEALHSTKLQKESPIVALPMNKPERFPRPEAADRMRPIVRVLGQYKPDRDLAALRAIAADINEEMTLEVIGRRWPQLGGWEVRDAFVPEDELDQLIRSSRCIVVPYSRFFQSAIAIRALESSVPIVGPAATSLDWVLGTTSAWLATSPGDWPRAVRAAVEETSNASAEAVAADVYQRTRRSWASWLEDLRT